MTTTLNINFTLGLLPSPTQELAPSPHRTPARFGGSPPLRLHNPRGPRRQLAPPSASDPHPRPPQEGFHPGTASTPGPSAGGRRSPGRGRRGPRPLTAAPSGDDGSRPNGRARGGRPSPDGTPFPPSRHRQVNGPPPSRRGRCLASRPTGDATPASPPVSGASRTQLFSRPLPAATPGAAPPSQQLLLPPLPESRAPGRRAPPSLSPPPRPALSRPAARLRSEATVVPAGSPDLPERAWCQEEGGNAEGGGKAIGRAEPITAPPPPALAGESSVGGRGVRLGLRMHSGRAGGRLPVFNGPRSRGLGPLPRLRRWGREEAKRGGVGDPRGLVKAERWGRCGKVRGCRNTHSLRTPPHAPAVPFHTVLSLAEGAVIPSVKIAVAASQVTGGSSQSRPVAAQEASVGAVPNHWVFELITH